MLEFSLLADRTLIVLLFLVNFLCFNLHFASRNPEHNKTQNKISATKRDFLVIEFKIFLNCIS